VVKALITTILYFYGPKFLPSLHKLALIRNIPQENVQIQEFDNFGSSLAIIYEKFL